MCLAETRSNGSILGLVRSKIGPVFSSIIRFGLVEASGPVKFKGLLIIVIVIVPSQLLEEASKHLCSLGVLLLQPFKDILNATLDHRVQGVSISSGDVLLLDALGDNVAKQDLLVTLVRSLHVSSSLHDLSALVVIGGEVVLAASSDGGHDGWVLLLGSPLSSSAPSASSSLPGQALPWDCILEALLTSCLLGGISFAGVFAMSSNESLHYLLLHALAFASALAAPPPAPWPLAASVHRLHHTHRPLPGVEDAHGGLGHLTLQLGGGRLTEAPLSILLLQPVVEASNYGLQGLHVSGCHCRDLGSTGSHSLRPVLGGASLGRVKPALPGEVHLGGEALDAGLDGLVVAKVLGGAAEDVAWVHLLLLVAPLPPTAPCRDGKCCGR